MLKLLQYNIHVSNSGFDNAAQEINRRQVANVQAIDADIICLQEVFITEQMNAWVTGFEETYSLHALHAPH